MIFAVTWLKYIRYGVKLYPIKQSIYLIFSELDFIILSRHLIQINICFKSEDSRVHSEICIIYCSSKKSEFIVKTPSQSSCMFEDTSLGIGMTYLHILNDCMLGFTK